MRKIGQNIDLQRKLSTDSVINSANVEVLRSRYEEISSRFHSYLSFGAVEQHQNAIYHKKRYLDILSKTWSGKVLDVGNDKPFLSYFLRSFNRDSEFFTISYEIPESPFDLFEVDIEREEFPFPPDEFDWVIFTEVIEHLWRDPSFCVRQISRVLKRKGRLYLTTPNPCDRHSLVCVLWQANPNQRSGYFSTLESGHLHLWTVADLRLLLEAHGFEIVIAATENLYGHTKHDENIEKVIAQFSPYRHLMNEAVVFLAEKTSEVSAPKYPLEIYPDGVPVQVSGAITSFLDEYLQKGGMKS